MDKFKEEYKKEKGFECWAEGCDYGSFTDDYVNWLEKKLALTIPVDKKSFEIINSCGETLKKCNNCGVVSKELINNLREVAEELELHNEQIEAGVI